MILRGEVATDTGPRPGYEIPSDMDITWIDRESFRSGFKELRDLDSGEVAGERRTPRDGRPGAGLVPNSMRQPVGALVLLIPIQSAVLRLEPVVDEVGNGIDDNRLAGALYGERVPAGVVGKATDEGRDGIPLFVYVLLSEKLCAVGVLCNQALPAADEPALVRRGVRRVA